MILALALLSSPPGQLIASGVAVYIPSLFIYSLGDYLKIKNPYDNDMTFLAMYQKILPLYHVIEAVCSAVIFMPMILTLPLYLDVLILVAGILFVTLMIGSLLFDEDEEDELDKKEIVLTEAYWVQKVVEGTPIKNDPTTAGQLPEARWLLDAGDHCFFTTPTITPEPAPLCAIHLPSSSRDALAENDISLNVVESRRAERFF